MRLRRLRSNVLAAVVAQLLLLCSFSSASTAASPAPASSASESAVDALLAEARASTEADGSLVGPQAFAAFCECDKRLGLSVARCAAVEAQCRQSFCNPLCLASAWQLELEVDCDAAPAWKYCAEFRSQVLSAARAVTSRFQAFQCVSAGLCAHDDLLDEFIENHSYGSQWPEHMLPIQTCLPELHDLHPAVGAATCAACSKTVTAKIVRGSCTPAFVPGFEARERSALQERCEFVVDFISSHAHSLLLELQQSVCACLGCCAASTENGGRECYFPNRQKAWLADLIERVSDSVSAKLDKEKTLAAEAKAKRDNARRAAASAAPSHEQHKEL